MNSVNIEVCGESEDEGELICKAEVLKEQYFRSLPSTIKEGDLISKAKRTVLLYT